MTMTEPCFILQTNVACGVCLQRRESEKNQKDAGHGALEIQLPSPGFWMRNSPIVGGEKRTEAFLKAYLNVDLRCID